MFSQNVKINTLNLKINIFFLFQSLGKGVEAVPTDNKGRSTSLESWSRRPGGRGWPGWPGGRSKSQATVCRKAAWSALWLLLLCLPTSSEVIRYDGDVNIGNVS